MPAPTVCMIHECCSNDNAIGKVALAGVRVALAAGYRVTVVAERIDAEVKKEVEHLPLYVPPRGLVVKWLTARRFIRRALGGRRFDIVHAHQPQVADLADVFQCHYLTRAAYTAGCLEGRPGVRSKLTRAQEQVILLAEDRHYRRWNPATRMLFGSALTRRHFEKHYGLPPREAVLPLPFPEVDFATPAQRTAARRKYIGPIASDPPNGPGDLNTPRGQNNLSGPNDANGPNDTNGPNNPGGPGGPGGLTETASSVEQSNTGGVVVGYLGGINERKGYRRLLDAAAREPGLKLVIAGSHAKGLTDQRLGRRLITIGLTADTPGLYAACDAIAVPSHYEPLGLVAFEAAARGTPVLCTDEVGALPHLLDFGVGARWNPAEPLTPLVRQMTADPVAFEANVRTMADALGAAAYRDRLLAVYDQVLAEKSLTVSAMPAVSRG